MRVELTICSGIYLATNSVPLNLFCLISNAFDVRASCALTVLSVLFSCNSTVCTAVVLTVLIAYSVHDMARCETALTRDFYVGAWVTCETAAVQTAQTVPINASRLTYVRTPTDQSHC